MWIRVRKLYWFSLGLLGVLHGTSFLNRHLFDDEAHNLRILESFSSYRQIVEYANGGDVHPPGQYIFNYFLYGWLGEVEYLWIAPSLLLIISIGWFLRVFSRSVEGEHAFLFLALFLAINSNFLLWVQSLRWYSYWNPLFIIVYGIVLTKPLKRIETNLYAVAAILGLMTYISYLTLILIPPLIASMLVCKGRTDNTIVSGQYLRTMAKASAIYLLIVAYQIIPFVTVHLSEASPQRSGLLTALAFSIYTPVFGSGLFPLQPAIIPLASALFIIAYKVKSISLPDYVLFSLIFLVFSLFCLSFTGIGGKYRNSIFLVLPVGILIAWMWGNFMNHHGKTSAWIVFFLAFSTWVYGSYQVLEGEGGDTLKGSYNLPVTALVSQISTSQESCNKTIVLHHDPVLRYYLFRERLSQVSYYSRRVHDKTLGEVSLNSGDCVYFIHTYRGSMSEKDFLDFQAMEQATARKTQSPTQVKLKFDKFSRLKNFLLGRIEVPEYYVVVNRFQLTEQLDLKTLGYFSGE